MNATQAHVLDRIEAHPKYRELRRKRGRLGWLLTIVMLFAYFGFIGLIAFDREFLARRIGDGITTIGIPIALGLIVFTVLLTGLYIWRANSAYDRLVHDLLQETDA